MACHTVLLLITWVISAVCSTGTKGEDHEPQCQSDNDYGWPRFHSIEELKASPWASYILSVYGELPSTYPVCIYDLWSINKDAYKEANITGHTLVSSTEVKEGDLFEGGGTGYMIYHGSYKPLPDNTWFEVTHTTFPTELKGSWMWRQRGSGIWYNTGKTKVFPTPEDPTQTHKEAIDFLKENCSITPSWEWPQLESDIFGLCAREKGYDTIQFEPATGQKPMGTFGLTGLTEVVLVNIDGKYSCGVEDASKTPYREGWMASRQCNCQNVEIADSCGLMPRAPFPFSIIGTSPPLCKLQGEHFWSRWRSCDPMTCKPTTCRLHTQTFTEPAIKRPTYTTVAV